MTEFGSVMLLLGDPAARHDGGSRPSLYVVGDDATEPLFAGVHQGPVARVGPVNLRP